jgi:hypothetical protein
LARTTEVSLAQLRAVIEGDRSLLGEMVTDGNGTARMYRRPLPS